MELPSPDLAVKILEAAGKVAKAIYAVAKDPVKRRLALLLSEHHARKMASYAEDVDAIKTIYQPERQVSLRKIYYPVSVIVHGKEFVPEHADDLLGGRRCVLIEAIAGHGKSLLMRHICLTEFCRGRYIPLLVILRRIQDAETLFQAIISEFSTLGFPGDERLLLTLLKEGRLLLLLDGYDEIHPYRRRAIAKELERLAKHWAGSRIIISSRPDLGLRSENYLTSATIMPLKQDDQIAFVTRLIEDEVERERFIGAINRSKFISKVVTTPLLVTLLLIAYRAESRIPESLVEFYDLLFPTLMYRHDDMKIGLNRFRRSTIGRYRLQDLFEAVSFLLSKAGRARFSARELFLEMRKAASLVSLNATDEEIENIRHDLLEVTCLIVEDGYEQFAYIHKSVQDFFAAKFILASGDMVTGDFYDSMLASFDTYQSWAQVVLFLTGLNEHLYEARFLSPLYRRYFNSQGKLKRAAFRALVLDGCYIVVTERGRYVRGSFADGFLRLLTPACGLIEAGMERFVETASAEIEAFLCSCDVEIYDSIHRGVDENVIVLKTLLSEPGMAEDLYRTIVHSSAQTVRHCIDEIGIRVRTFGSRQRAISLANYS